MTNPDTIRHLACQAQLWRALYATSRPHARAYRVRQRQCEREIIRAAVAIEAQLRERDNEHTE